MPILNSLSEARKQHQGEKKSHSLLILNNSTTATVPGLKTFFYLYFSLLN